ncbi:MAG: hypothetical protein HN975_02050 [Anaerolineae bacterium]|jgi:hypothetical protein|nr:hypothetical protein [Anaerolineae bacterium]
MIIQLSNGSTEIDDADFEKKLTHHHKDFDHQIYVCDFNWRISRNGYVCSKYTISGKQYYILMHRLIMEAKPGQICDHINKNRLLNIRSNLRFATVKENAINRTKKSGCTSQFRGVSWNKRGQKWRASIGDNYKLIHLGHFENEIDAAMAYNEAAIGLFGEFAQLNICNR